MATGRRSGSAWATGSPTTRNDVDLRGFRVEAIHRGDTGVRVGAELQTGHVDLVGGDRPGGYIEGRYRRPFDWAAGYAEVERRIGPLRLAPGLRVARAPDRDAVYLAPRLSARVDLVADIALTMGLSRSYQALSTLRDDRYALPGPPLWFAHGSGAPVSRADGVSAAIEGWLGQLWSVSLSGFARRFDDLPAWRPAGDRRLDGIQWDDGTASGFEAVARRHGERLHGWLSYGHSRTRMTEVGGDPYYPTWDRSHAVDLAVFAELAGLTFGSRVVYGTGTPFWGRAGTEQAKFLAPGTGKIEDREGFPVWGGEQQRFPDYFRADLFARYRFRWGRLSVEPFVGVLNLTARPNVVYYDYVTRNEAPLGQPPEIVARLEPEAVLVSVPTLGFDIHF